MQDFLTLKNILHYFFHFIFPVFVALIFFKKNWKKAYLIMLATMLVDLDHLFANPIFDPDRNSIGFHFLHSYPAIAIYLLGCIFTKRNFRIIFLGLLLHMATDFADFFVF